MIASFGDPATEDLFHGRRTSRVRRFSREVARSALLKLDALNAANDLDDLSSPPGNRLEPLRGELRGFFSIRVNAQWRIIFRWKDHKASSVSIVDYHS
jgi:proteic killer suppression protein